MFYVNEVIVMNRTKKLQTALFFLLFIIANAVLSEIPDAFNEVPRVWFNLFILNLAVLAFALVLKFVFELALVKIADRLTLRELTAGDILEAEGQSLIIPLVVTIICIGIQFFIFQATGLPFQKYAGLIIQLTYLAALVVNIDKKTNNRKLIFVIAIYAIIYAAFQMLI